MWIGSNTKIHEQKGMAETLRPREEALRESEAYLRFRLVLDPAADGFYGVDRDGVTTTCNAAFLRMFERAEDVVGKKLHDVIHHSHADGSPYPKEECHIYRTARTGGAAHIDKRAVLPSRWQQLSGRILVLPPPPR
jgi:PAS domain-containing protein